MKFGTKSLINDILHNTREGTSKIEIRNIFDKGTSYVILREGISKNEIHDNTFDKNTF
ncbi:12499_t:CDS:2 [Acaulospora morrowiae]|uniref:12499_t:CDS:1 n=1 Tax=Acaulospora morrowiae TaxID=94023 RepID=A0A9N9A6L2_9GLOM|nr:12499_t:CDS:2 [Acaulospora morrowiae]